MSPVRGLKRFPLDQQHDIVGGFVEYTELRNGQVIVSRADAKWEDLPVNEKATKLRNMSYPDEYDYVAGNVLVCDSDMIEE